jgi:hypothetical protein
MSFDPAVLETVSQRFRRDMWCSVAPDAIGESGVEVKQFGPVQATVFADLPEEPMLNQIQGSAEPGAIEDGHLGEAVEWMRFREVDYHVPVAENRPESAEAEAWLADRGYERGCALSKFVRPMTPVELPPTGSTIVVYELGDGDWEGEGLSMIAAEALDLPITAAALFYSLHQLEHWRCYTAAMSTTGPLVATGATMIHNGIAQLGLATTLEDFRGKGCNWALLRRRLIDAAASGCHTAFVEVCEDGRTEDFGPLRRNLSRAGFKEAYVSWTWQRPALRPARVR